MTVESTASTASTASMGLPPIDAGWRSWRGAHGGVLAALLLRQARGMLGTLTPRSLHASFLESVTDEALRADTVVQRRSWASTVTRSELYHGTSPAVLATALFADPARAPEHPTEMAPAVPPPHECPELPAWLDVAPALQHVEIRLATDARPLSGGAAAEFLAWIRLRDFELDAPEAVVVLLDSMPPAFYAVLADPVPIPSAEISVRFTGAVRPEPLNGWCLIEVRTEQAGPEWALESGKLWNAEGELLGVSLQTRRVVAEDDLRIPRLGELARAR